MNTALRIISGSLWKPQISDHKGLCVFLTTARHWSSSFCVLDSGSATLKIIPVPAGAKCHMVTSVEVRIYLCCSCVLLGYFYNLKNADEDWLVQNPSAILCRQKGILNQGLVQAGTILPGSICLH